MHSPSHLRVAQVSSRLDPPTIAEENASAQGARRRAVRAFDTGRGTMSSCHSLAAGMVPTPLRALACVPARRHGNQRTERQYPGVRGGRSTPCGCATSRRAPMPIRAPWTWTGATRGFRCPVRASRRVGMYTSRTSSARVAPVHQSYAGRLSSRAEPSSAFAMPGPRPTSREDAVGDLPNGGSTLGDAPPPRRSVGRRTGSPPPRSGD